MFNTSIFSPSRQEQKQQQVAEAAPFGGQLFAMMAASTVSIAFGGPNRAVAKTSPPTPAVAVGEVKGWFIYDPKTEEFRQSSIDVEKEEEQVAANALVDACALALAPPTTTTTCAEAGSGLMRSSFSFAVNDVPLASHGQETETGSSRSRGETTGPVSPRCSGSQSSGLTFFPRLEKDRLVHHRGSVMEAGVVLDARVFGGIGIVQEGRRVGVRKSEDVTRALGGTITR